MPQQGKVEEHERCTPPLIKVSREVQSMEVVT